MRTPLPALAVVLLAAGCGQQQSSSAPLGAVETEYVAALRGLQQPLHLPDDDNALVGLGRSACTQLAYDVQHLQSAAASYMKAAAGGDYPTAFAITWSAAQHLCPQSATGPVSSTPTGPEPTQGAFTPAPEPSGAPEASQQDPGAGLNDVGKTESNGGITLTVKSASQTDTILMNESNFRPGSGYERYTKTAAGAGAKYVVVATHVVNNAKTSLDLTCGLPVTAKLVDDQQRNFDPIDDLYKLKGNPECNKNLQPGFESTCDLGLPGAGSREDPRLEPPGHHGPVEPRQSLHPSYTCRFERTRNGPRDAGSRWWPWCWDRCCRSIGGNETAKGFNRGIIEAPPSTRSQP